MTARDLSGTGGRSGPLDVDDERPFTLKALRSTWVAGEAGKVVANGLSDSRGVAVDSAFWRHASVGKAVARRLIY